MTSVSAHEEVAMQHEVELAIRLAVLPLMGGLAVLSAVRDNAARVRVRDDEGAAARAVAWQQLSPEMRAMMSGWTERG
jgi:hypothetical protein